MIDLAVFEKIPLRIFAVIILIFFLTGIAGFFARRFLNKIKTSNEENKWLQAFGSALSRPLPWLIWGYGVLLIAEVMSEANQFPLLEEYINQGRLCFFIGGFTWVLYRWKTESEELLFQSVFLEKTKSDKALFGAVSKLTSVVIFSISSLMVLDIFGVPLTTLMTLGGIGSLTIGWAGKDVVVNFFGGLMIFITRPFAVDDWIYLPNKSGFEGVVEHIGWYQTRIRTFSRRPTYFPNGLFLDAIIENPGRMYNRQIKAVIGLRYDDIAVVKSVVDDIEKMLKEHPDIAKDQILMVHFLAFGPTSLDLQIYCFTRTTVWSEYRDIQQDVFLRTASIVASHGAEIAFPTQTLHIQQEPPAPQHV